MNNHVKWLRQKSFRSKVIVGTHRHTHIQQTDHTTRATNVVGRNFVRPHNTRTKMYAGRVACCILVSHVEYEQRALLNTGQTD